MSDWPVVLSGVTETVVATQGPDGRWNLAALGVHPPAENARTDSSQADAHGENPPSAGAATARTWGETRTRRNFEHRGEAVVQFTRDPLLFVEAALDVVERDQPVHEGRVDAWVRVDVERSATGREGDTEWVDWRLHPVESAVVSASPGRFARGPAAVVEASVAASRLDVPAYDTEPLRERIAYFGDVVDRCGDERTREAFERLRELADVDPS